jgi:hypothetical protein
MTLKANSLQQTTRTLSLVERSSQPAGRPARIRIRCAVQHLATLPVSVTSLASPLAAADALLLDQQVTSVIDAPARAYQPMTLAVADEEEDEDEDVDDDDDDLDDDDELEEDDEEEDFDEDDDEPEYDDEDDDVIDDEEEEEDD